MHIKVWVGTFGEYLELLMILPSALALGNWSCFASGFAFVYMSVMLWNANLLYPVCACLNGMCSAALLLLAGGQAARA